MGLVRELFTWWNGQTLGTRLFTARNGQRVGEDGEGNRYYQTRDGKRRWVVYSGVTEASRVPPDWHGWLHHTYDAPPSRKPLARQSWEKPHQQNMTGTHRAYHPPGSIKAARPALRSDYEAWTPGG